jgi:hypothetical protein
MQLQNPPATSSERRAAIASIDVGSSAGNITSEIDSTESAIACTLCHKLSRVLPASSHAERINTYATPHILIETADRPYRTKSDTVLEQRTVIEVEYLSQSSWRCIDIDLLDFHWLSWRVELAVSRRLDFQESSEIIL